MVDQKAAQRNELPQPDSETIVEVPVGQLLLDPENPRLAGVEVGSSQDDLVKVLWTNMSVDELAFSIAANGFFPSEPLLVVIRNPENQDPEKREYIVVEGNRRLAAVLLLCNETLRKQVRATNLPAITQERRAELDALPVIIYPDRRDLWTAVGFRHVNGVQRWDSYSKAEYIADVRDQYHIPLEEIAAKGPSTNNLPVLLLRFRIAMRTSDLRTARLLVDGP